MPTRIRGLLGVVSGVALAFACAAGCQKDQPRPGERGNAESGEGASRPVVTGESRARRGSIPLDTWSAAAESIVAIDLGQLRRSPLGPLAHNLLRTSLAAPVGCANGAIEQLSQLLIVSTSPQDSQPIYVLNGVHRRHAESCASRPSVWLDDHTLAIAPGWEQADLEAVTSGKRGRTNPAVLASISEVDTNAAIWFAAAKPADSNGWHEEFTEMRGAIALDSGLRASFSVKYPTAERADSAAKEFERTIETLTPFTQYFEDAKAHSDGVWMQGRIIVSRDQLARLPEDPIFSGMFPPPEPEVTIVEDGPVQGTR